MVGRLDTIDSVLRSTSASGTVKYNAITPFLDQFAGVLATGGNMMISATIDNITSTRILPFQGEIHTTFQQTTTYDLLGNSPK